MDCMSQLHIAAYHARGNYNNDTPGIGVLCALPTVKDTRLAVGTFYNSYKRTSVYAAVVWQPLLLGPVRAGLLAGAVTGYKLDTSIALPLAAIAMSLPVNRFELHLTAIPEVAKASPTTAELSVSFRF